ncbi:BA14K family protein [Aquabacter spiritensis]|uniref:Lectin-like protein BA14k n=1 Tax=Aquabacter spiritensis TaxID=933073 RepID=A0A4R3LZC7_9HYPH|nr:BA14K family protein [Aquabacter spiritensis]TCT05656.1 BA14K-like protein [Aquabacter spiritensis]
MRTSLSLLAACALAGVTIASGAQAQSLRPAPLTAEAATTNVQWRGGGPGWGPRRGYGPGPNPYYRNCGWGGCNNNNNGAAVAAGVIGGLMLGAAAASAAQANQPPTVYYAPGPGGGPNQAQWIAYCSNKYKSFDPRTGTYLGYDGRRHPCQ